MGYPLKRCTQGNQQELAKVRSTAYRAPGGRVGSKQRTPTI